MPRKIPPAGMKRRDFLKAAGISLMAPAVMPRRLFAQTSPVDLMQLGVIGTGRQGQADMQELIYRGLETGARVVAVCDVDSHRLEDAQWLAERIYTSELGKASYKGSTSIAISASSWPGRISTAS